MRLLVTLAALPLVACSFSSDDGQPGIAGTGSGNSRSYPASGFSKVVLGGADDIDVKVGGGFSVRAEGDPKLLEALKIEQDGDTLKVGRRRGTSWGDGQVKVFVTMPRIAAGAVAGAGDLTIDRVQGAGFDASLAGSGNIAIAAVSADSLDLNIAGAGNIAAAGTAKSVSARIAGAGDIDAAKLAAAGADVSILGSGNVRIAVDGAAKVSIMGSGDVDLGPKAKCAVSKMGSGDVTCGG